MHVAMNGTITLRSNQFGNHDGYEEFSRGAMVAAGLTYKIMNVIFTNLFEGDSCYARCKSQ